MRSIGQTIKTVPVVFPAAIVDNDDFAGAKGDASPVSVDTKGFHEARVCFLLGATDITIAKMNVFESDDDTTYTEIPGLDFTDDSSAPGADDDNKLYICHIDLSAKRKRYLQLDFAAGDGTSGTYGVAWVDLFRGDEVPDTATERGAADELYPD